MSPESIEKQEKFRKYQTLKKKKNPAVTIYCQCEMGWWGGGVYGDDGQTDRVRLSLI